MPAKQALDVNRLIALIADWLDLAAGNGPPGWLPRPLVLGLLVLFVAAGAYVATSLLSREPGAITGVLQPGTGEPPGVASPDLQSDGDTPEPSDSVAASRRLVADFDTLPTGSVIEGWTLSEGARLVTAARPTAVDRSARLDGEGTATACQELDIELVKLEARFMIDSVPESEVALLALALDGESEQRLTLTDGSATSSPTGDAVALEADTWYRWTAVRADEGLQLRLVSIDGAPLTESIAPTAAASARATEFCMTAPPSTSLYLTDLTVETR